MGSETNLNIRPAREYTAATSSPQSSTRRKLTDNIVSLYALTSLYYLIPLAVLPYLVRILGMERYGQMALAQSYSLLFSTVTDYGFNYSATRSIAANRENHETVSEIFCSVFLIKFVLAIAGLLIMLTMITVVPRFHEDSAFFLVGYIAVIGNTLFPTWYFQGMERMRWISVIIGMSRIVSAAALFVFVHRPTDALLALGLQSAGTLLGGLIGLGMAVRSFHIKMAIPSSLMLKTTLADGWHLFLSTAGIGLYTNINVFLVGTLAGNLQAGYFAAAERILRAMQAFIGPVIQAIFPHIASLQQQSREKALSFVNKTIYWIGGATALPSIFIFLFATTCTVLLFGKNAMGSASVVRWIAFLPVLSALSNVLGVNTMIAFGMDRQFSRIVITGGLLNVSLGSLLIHNWGANGAGASILIVELVIVAGIVLSLKKAGIHPLRSHSDEA
jgi:polysaccharide transporter, PST family